MYRESQQAVSETNDDEIEKMDETEQTDDPGNDQGIVLLSTSVQSSLGLNQNYVKTNWKIAWRDNQEFFIFKALAISS